MTARRVVVLAGDGVGPEVTAQAEAVLGVAARAAGVEISFDHQLIGGHAIEETGTPLPDASLAACRSADAVLLGAVGGPRWDHLRGETRCEAGLLRLRKELGLFANLRPVRVHPALAERSTLRPEVLAGVDLVVVRELTGGIYFGEPRGREGSGADETAVDTMIYSRAEIERVARVAFELAGQRTRRLMSVDKANVLVSSQLWRDAVTEIARDHPDITVEHQLVDSCAMRLVRSPRDFDIIVTENLFGDILTDEAAMLTGSLGMLPSASLGAAPGDSGREAGAGEPPPLTRRVHGVYEPIHGSAPDIAGQGLANPLGAVLSAAMLLRHSLDLPGAARTVESAVDAVVTAGVLTRELGGDASTEQVGEAVIEALSGSAVAA